jgi:hypothetical protein
MIVSGPSTALLIPSERSNTARSDTARAARSTPSGPDSRQRLMLQAAALEAQARSAAERGDLEAAARTILEALDCERKADGLGPQVLQLIKPRS